MIDIAAIKARFEALEPVLDQRERRLFAASENGTIYALDANGKTRLQHKTEGVVYSSPAIGPDGTMYVGSTDGHLYAFR